MKNCIQPEKKFLIPLLFFFKTCIIRLSVTGTITSHQISCRNTDIFINLIF